MRNLGWKTGRGFAPCPCDKCLDCIAADGYEAAQERIAELESRLQHYGECADTPLMRDMIARAERAEARVRGLEKALRFLADLHDEHEPLCAVNFEKPMACDCEYGVIRAALEEKP